MCSSLKETNTQIHTLEENNKCFQMNYSLSDTFFASLVCIIILEYNKYLKYHIVFRRHFSLCILYASAWKGLAHSRTLAQSSTFHLLFVYAILLLLYSMLWHKFHFKKHKIRARYIFSNPLIWFTISLNQLMDIPLAPIHVSNLCIYKQEQD